jgi:hypothetical protein
LFVERKNLLIAEVTAREIGVVSLDEALSLVPLVAEVYVVIRTVTENAKTSKFEQHGLRLPVVFAPRSGRGDRCRLLRDPLPLVRSPVWRVGRVVAQW